MLRCSSGTLERRVDRALAIWSRGWQQSVATAANEGGDELNGAVSAVLGDRVASTRTESACHTKKVCSVT